MSKQTRERNGTRKQPARPRLKEAEDLFAGRYPPRPEGGPVENVDPRWLLKAAAIAIAAALLCAYATLCLLVYQGQWQLFLHPVAAAALSGYPLESATDQSVRFGAGDTGQPQMAGLWLPATDATPLTPTILYLPDGSGNLLADADALNRLHALPVNLFAFDYRGFGASAATTHPTEARMHEDTSTALDYLVNTRHIPPSRIVPYGVGLGAAMAAALAEQHPDLPAVILEAPRPGAERAALADSRARLVPLHFFLHERFDVSGPLARLKTPKLLLESGPSSSAGTTSTTEFTSLARQASSPSMVVHLNPVSARNEGALTAWRASMLRFLDEYLPGSATGLGGKPTL